MTRYTNLVYMNAPHKYCSNLFLKGATVLQQELKYIIGVIEDPDSIIEKATF